MTWKGMGDVPVSRQECIGSGQQSIGVAQWVKEVSDGEALDREFLL